MPHDVLLWLVLLVIFIIAEASTTTLYCLWFALGAVAALIPASAQAHLWVQLAVFAAVSAGTLALLRPLAKKYLKKGKTPTNSDRNIGETAVCTERIDNQAGQGAVRLMGKEWTARTAHDEIVEPGAVVRVEAISGVKLIVSAVSEQDGTTRSAAREHEKSVV